MKKSTTATKKTKSVSEEARYSRIDQTLTPALSQGARGEIEIDARIAAMGDWRGDVLARVRDLIKQADPDVVEEVKWRKPSNSMRGIPVWSHAGIICNGETYKDKVKLTFAKGASLKDPARLFNSSLEGNARRAIDIHEGDKVNEAALKDLIRAAVVLNLKSTAKPKPRRAGSKRAG